MTLRKKTLLIIGITLACLIVFLYSVSSAFLINGFSHVERQDIQKNVYRVLEALYDDLAALNGVAGDWAAWDETYSFIDDGNLSYIERNIYNKTFIEMKLNFMLFVDSSGEIVWERNFDLKNETIIPVPESLHKHISVDSVLLQHSAPDSSVKGIVLLPEGPALIVSRPILDNERKKPVRGSMIWGRYLDDVQIKRLGEITHLSLAVQGYNDTQMLPDFQAVSNSFSEEEPIVVRPLSEQSIAGYTIVKDIYGKPALLLQVDMPRVIYGQGKVSIQYLFFSLMLVGLVFGGMSLWLLEKLILSRLSRLNVEVTEIGKNTEFSGRVVIEGEDELSSLGGSINRMLEALDRSLTWRRLAAEELKKHRNHLEELVEGRTEELKIINKKLQREINERRRAEDDLKKSEEKYRSLVESTDDSIYMVDIKGNYLFINSKHRARLGIGDYCGRNYGDCHWSIDTERFMQSISRIFDTGIREQHEHEFRGKWFLRTLSSIKDPETKKVTAVIVVSTEITHRKKAEEMHIENERLASASRAKSEFLANMSHELRTPLNSIIGFTDLLKQKTQGELNNKQERYIDNVLTSSRFLLNIINDILDLSKVEAGKIELVMEKVSVQNVIEDSIVLLKEKAVKHKIILKKEIDPALDFIEADKLRVKQILFNLLSNAVKFSKKDGGIVTVTAKKEGDMAKISVSDTGIGIKEEDMGKLFQEFSQVDASISVKYGGTGLGLAITKKLVELHSGRIWAESKYGEGATFTFTMPIEAVELNDRSSF